MWRLTSGATRKVLAAPGLEPLVRKQCKKSGRPRGQGRPVRKRAQLWLVGASQMRNRPGRVRRDRTPHHYDTQKRRNFLDPNALILRDVTILRSGCRCGPAIDVRQRNYGYGNRTESA